MQCTPPPPPILDVFPKPCDNGLDCFPNLCCQEGGKRFCRPPKRSILALVAGIGQVISYFFKHVNKADIKLYDHLGICLNNANSYTVKKVFGPSEFRRWETCCLFHSEGTNSSSCI